MGTAKGQERLNTTSRAGLLLASFDFSLFGRNRIAARKDVIEDAQRAIAVATRLSL